MEDVRAATLVVVQILDDERIVQIDDCRNRARVREEIVGNVSLNDGNVGVIAVLQKCVRRDRRRQEAHAMAVGLEHFLHLEKTDSDSCRMAVSERLRTDEENAAHALPFILSTISCSFHVRDLKISSRRSCSRPTSANIATFVCCDSACAAWRSFKRTAFSWR